MPTHDEGFFSARDNLRLFWESDVPDNPKAHVALVHGYGDHSGRYRRTIDALVKDGFAVHAFDYRGHGQADGRRGYAEKWTDFLSDLELFLEKTKGKTGGKKLFVLAHSHGGLMLVHHLHERGDAGLSGAVVSAPYLKLAITPPAFKLFSAKIVGKIIPWLPIATELTSKDLTADAELQAEADRDPLYGRVVTPRWFLESTAAQGKALTWGSDVKLPVFVFCGEKDGVASPAATKKFFGTIASADKTFKEYPGTFHEPWNDVNRADVWRDISLWISAHL